MANGARAEGMEANLFFTFFGLDAIHKDRYEHIKLATVGNPGLHLPTWIGIGLSVGLMLVAMTGAIPAVAGALVQELVDLATILYALRALGGPPSGLATAGHVSEPRAGSRLGRFA